MQRQNYKSASCLDKYLDSRGGIQPYEGDYRERFGSITLVKNNYIEGLKRMKELWKSIA
ncbi:MAG: hypothetical protein ABI045_05540 [Flavobacteriales bacterium]